MTNRLLLLFVLLLPITGCSTPKRPTVIVMGMIHGAHLTNPDYSTADVEAIVRRVDPDFILTEIPPDRLDLALAQFDMTGTVTESRVSRFPEYVDAIIPLTATMDFEIIPCAAWTESMALARQKKLEELHRVRTEASQEIDAAMAAVDRHLAEAGFDGTPASIHTDGYDEIVRTGMEPYNRLFNNDLGPGGWDNINAAHWALIEQAIESHGGGDTRFLITFGSWHKYWFKDRLRERDDIKLVSLREFLDEPAP